MRWHRMYCVCTSLTSIATWGEQQNCSRSQSCQRPECASRCDYPSLLGARGSRSSERLVMPPGIRARQARDVLTDDPVEPEATNARPKRPCKGYWCAGEYAIEAPTSWRDGRPRALFDIFRSGWAGENDRAVLREAYSLSLVNYFAVMPFRSPETAMRSLASV